MRTPYRHYPEFNPAGNQGMALFVSLVMLLILTVLGISSVQSTSMQERMARNAMDANLAFQAAESAIRDAEAYMEGLSDLDDFPLDSPGAITPSAAAANGYYVQVAPDQADVWETVDWDGALVRTAESTVDGVAAQPKYLIEFLKTVVSDQDRLNLDNIGQDTGSGRTQMFRVTAYGTGGTSSAHVTIQSSYGKRF